MGRYAEARGKNERAEVIEVRGTLATDAKGAIKEMAEVAAGSRCGDFLYHLQINPEKGDRLTPEQWRRAVEIAEKKLGLENHQRVVFAHIKDGREHYHVVWNRVDAETLLAVNMGHNYRAHERAAQQMEREFGLEPVERRPNLEGGRKADRAPESWQYKQAERTKGQNPREMKAEVKSILRRAGIEAALEGREATGSDFAAALADHGYKLAKGDRRDFVLIDAAGGEHSLGRMAGIKAAELRELMADVDREKLPSVDQAKQEQVARSLERTAQEIGGSEPREKSAPAVQQMRPPDFGRFAGHAVGGAGGSIKRQVDEEREVDKEHDRER